MVKKSLSSLSSSSEKKRKSSINGGGGGGIKKNNSKHVNRGAWSAEEDKKLADYVKTHGDKRWRSLPSEAGLNRCGKSCRLRWLNYLRPGIKRGNITEDEEDLIIRLHNLLGNRWSLIAGRLPGRTDNEIKNHWNTHLSKKSLTINELNLKLNQKLDDHNPNISNTNTNTNTPSVFLTTTTSSFTPDWSELSHPLDQTMSNRRDETDLSNPMNGYLDEDLDFNGLFDFSVGSDFLESDNPLVSSSELTRVQDDYNLLDEQMYHKYFDSDQVVVQGTSTAGSLDEDFACNRLDFEGLLYSENIDDDVFFSFS